MLWAQTVDNGCNHWSLLNLLDMSNLDTQTEGLKTSRNTRTNPAKSRKILQKLSNSRKFRKM